MQSSGGGPGALHRPVLLSEVLDCLRAERGGLFVDATLGLGGHSEAILSFSSATRVVGLDCDGEAVGFSEERLKRFGPRFHAVRASFVDLESVLRDFGETEAAGILADLGVSSLQLDTGSRGFSFRHDAPLDMRMDDRAQETAGELLERLPEQEIARILFEYGEERKSRRIARWITTERARGRQVGTTAALASLVERASGKGTNRHIHPATRTFQALRIAVNSELENLQKFLPAALRVILPTGRLAVISFHSLEDRVVKRAFRRFAGFCECGPRVPRCSCGARKEVRILTPRPIIPSPIEVAENARARSAKLRACEKLN